MVENNESKTTIDMVNGLSEIADYMQDEELTSALVTVAKLIVKPDMEVEVSPPIKSTL